MKRITFDNQGLMYVGGGKKIYTITPKDRVVKVSPEGDQSVIIIEGSQFAPPLEWLVEIEFRSHFEKL